MMDEVAEKSMKEPIKKIFRPQTVSLTLKHGLSSDEYDAKFIYLGMKLSKFRSHFEYRYTSKAPLAKLLAIDDLHLEEGIYLRFSNGTVINIPFSEVAAIESGTKSEGEY
ncbi:hypothetical protein [Fructilactobacillus frigidiflavus]|uniref:hypothetical protein n=1 Tax=Fructilactobacillus frigidiflavus TaxID=3242688 RepID=UPI00375688E8